MLLICVHNDLLIILYNTGFFSKTLFGRVIFLFLIVSMVYTLTAVGVPVKVLGNRQIAPSGNPFTCAHYARAGFIVRLVLFLVLKTKKSKGNKPGTSPVVFFHSACWFLVEFVSSQIKDELLKI